MPEVALRNITTQHVADLQARVIVLSKEVLTLEQQSSFSTRLKEEMDAAASKAEDDYVKRRLQSKPSYRAETLFISGIRAMTQRTGKMARLEFLRIVQEKLRAGKHYVDGEWVEGEASEVIRSDTTPTPGEAAPSSLSQVAAPSIERRSSFSSAKSDATNQLHPSASKNSLTTSGVQAGANPNRPASVGGSTSSTHTDPPASESFGLPRLLSEGTQSMASGSSKRSFTMGDCPPTTKKSRQDYTV